jgi:hypothetical protein
VRSSTQPWSMALLSLNLAPAASHYFFSPAHMLPLLCYFTAITEPLTLGSTCRYPAASKLLNTVSVNVTFTAAFQNSYQAFIIVPSSQCKLTPVAHDCHQNCQPCTTQRGARRRRHKGLLVVVLVPAVFSLSMKSRAISFFKTEHQTIPRLQFAVTVSTMVKRVPVENLGYLRESPKSTYILESED